MPDGKWFHTGDLGSIDRKGQLTITGRKKELIVTAGGKNVSPEVLEDSLATHPLIANVIVVGDQRPYVGALFILDADLTTPPEDMPKFYEALRQGKGEFINGCRLVYPMEKQAMRLLNLIANKSFGVLFSYLLGQGLKDTLCGTKVLYKSDYDTLKLGRAYFGDCDPFGDFDLLFGAAKLNLKMTEIIIRYKDREYGSTQISRFRHGWLLIKMCAFAARKIKFI